MTGLFRGFSVYGWNSLQSKLCLYIDARFTMAVFGSKFPLDLYARCVYTDAPVFCTFDLVLWMLITGY